jgi:hypothetical protein
MGLLGTFQIQIRTRTLFVEPPTQEVEMPLYCYLPSPCLESDSCPNMKCHLVSASLSLHSEGHLDSMGLLDPPLLSISTVFAQVNVLDKRKILIS